MKKLVILIGPPGSGKSTHALEMERVGYVRISQDDQGKEHINKFKAAVWEQKDIVIDRMNFDKQQRDRYRLPALSQGYEVSFVEFVVPKRICFDRCMARQGHPTILNKNNASSALYTYFSKYEEVLPEEGDVLYIKYTVANKTPAIMCDLDGTLCNLDHRLHHVKGDGKKDWGNFFSECINDDIYLDVAQLLNDLQAQSEYWGDNLSVVYCSGRPEDYKEQTYDWLCRFHMLRKQDELVMRPRNNYKSDDITKAMLYRYEIQPFYDVRFVLDDRDQVVRKWRSMGLNCWQVRPGDF